MVQARPLFGDDDEPIQAKPLEHTVTPLDLQNDATAVTPSLTIAPPNLVVATEVTSEPRRILSSEPHHTLLPLNFPDEPVRARHAVAPLDLPDVPTAPRAPSSQASILDLADPPETLRNRECLLASPSQISAPSEVFAAEEHPSVAPAMRRGHEKFPEMMKKSGSLIRNALNNLVPVSFESLSVHGNSTLTRAASLVDKIAAATLAVAEIRASEQIQDIVDRADSTKHRGSLLGFIEKSMMPFDPVAANVHLIAIKEALQVKLRVVGELRQEMIRIKDALAVEVTAMAILSDMTDRADIGALVVRKANLFNVSLQEVQTALTQVTIIEKSAQEWMMRCDEVKTVTLPALGFRASL